MYVIAADLLVLWLILAVNNSQYVEFMTAKRQVIYLLDTILISSYKPLESATGPLSEASYNGQNAHEEIIEAMKQIGIQFPEVAWAQAILETGWLQSQVYKKNHNLFGMKRNSRGFSKNPKEKTPRNCEECFDPDLHACYDSPYESMLDYKAWQDMILKNYKTVNGRYPKTEKEYLEMLNRLPIVGKKGIVYYRYASATHYTKAVKMVIEYVEDHPLILGAPEPKIAKMGILLGKIAL